MSNVLKSNVLRMSDRMVALHQKFSNSDAVCDLMAGWAQGTMSAVDVAHAILAEWDNLLTREIENG